MTWTPWIAAGLLMCTAAATFAQSSDQDSPVHARLIGETDAFVPGQVFHLGVSFDIAESWHMYWKNPGESGAPPKVTLNLPSWLKAGETQWPTPERLVLPGDILDYVYNDRLTLVIPLEVSADAPLGAMATITADLWWLMCDDNLCTPGEAVVSLAAPVAATAAPTATARLFEQSRGRQPIEPPTGELDVSWQAGRLTLRVAGASSLAFFPDPGVRPSPVGLVTSGESVGDRIIIEVDDAPARGQVPFTGTLRVHRASNKPLYWRVQAPNPEPGR